MENWYDCIDTMVITTTLVQEDGKTTVPGPTFTDPASLEHARHRCADKTCHSTEFTPHVVNKVVAMVKERETHGTTVAVCHGKKWTVDAEGEVHELFTALAVGEVVGIAAHGVEFPEEHTELLREQLRIHHRGECPVILERLGE